MTHYTYRRDKNEKCSVGEEKNTRAYKYDEPKVLESLKTHIDSTYENGYHYVGKDKESIQPIEFIESTGHVIGYLVGTIIAYLARYGKKGSQEDARKDLLKAAHMLAVLIHMHDKNG